MLRFELLSCSFFFFNDTATTEIYTLSLHDALPICWCWAGCPSQGLWVCTTCASRSEEHTSELQSHHDLVCRLLLEKKKLTSQQKRKISEEHTYEHQSQTKIGC